MGTKGLDFKHKEVININDGKILYASVNIYISV